MGITIKDIILTNLSFNRTPDIPGDVNITYTFEISSNHVPDKQAAQVMLRVMASDKAASITIDCSMVGMFCIPDEHDLPVSIDEFLHINAPAIIYP